MQNSDSSPLISIIVPVYKVEKYLPKCLKSILSQSFHSWELLLIDDGSPDRSGLICDQFASMDSRIKVIHKQNEGVSIARNTGLKIATGKYVMFIDSDDWIEEECLKTCIHYLSLHDLDFLQFGLSLVDDMGKVMSTKTTQCAVCSNMEFIKADSFNVCVGGSVYKKQIIAEHDLLFPINVALAEDQIFLMSFLANANKCMIISDNLYNYIQHESSATKTGNVAKYLNSIKALDAFRYKKLFMDKISYSIASQFLYLIALKPSNDEFDEAIGMMKRNNKSLTYRIRKGAKRMKLFTILSTISVLFAAKTLQVFIK